MAILECPNCHRKISDQAPACSECGLTAEEREHFRPMEEQETAGAALFDGKAEARARRETERIARLSTKRKSGPMAAALNFVLIGSGYAYCGHWLQGLFALGLAILAFLYFPLAVPFILIAAVVDGFLAANRYNRKVESKIQKAMKQCPQCTGKVLPAARVCKHCGHEFEPA